VICNLEKLLALHQCGKSLGKIAGELRMSKTTVSRIVNAAAL